jgi:hypothetical protein
LWRKDPLTLCFGPHRLRANPIYSQHTRGGGKGTNNVHKFERYLRHGVTCVATIYGPVAFGKQPCVLLRETSDLEGKLMPFHYLGLDYLLVADALRSDSTAPQLVAMGVFLNPDTTRVIAKRIILTGHPFKVHKKTATVRYMFFNPGISQSPPFPTMSTLLTPRLLCLMKKQMTCGISSLSHCIQNMDVRVIYANLSASTAISKHPLTGRSTRWIQCVCRFTSACFRGGASCGGKNEHPLRMPWRSNLSFVVDSNILCRCTMLDLLISQPSEATRSTSVICSTAVSQKQEVTPTRSH